MYYASSYIVVISTWYNYYMSRSTTTCPVTRNGPLSLISMFGYSILPSLLHQTKPTFPSTCLLLRRPVLPRILNPLINTTPHQHALTTTSPAIMRVPYAPKTPPTAAAEPIYARIAARRAPRPLIPLDLALLHNPQVADGWNSFVGALRTQTSVPAGLRELAISRVAVLNHAVHEWDVHAALAVDAGVSRTVLAAVLDAGADRVAETGLSEGEAAVLALTDQMTVGVRVEEAVMQRVKTVLGDQGTVEMVATVAGYNMVSRFLVALDVGECNERAMKKAEEL